MSAASRPLPAPARIGLLAKLMAQVRAEFRVEIYLAGPDDSVLGRRPCSVSDCDRSRAENGLCSAHGGRWRHRGRPEMAGFLTDPGPTLNGRRDLTGCAVAGCRYGSSGFGLCMRHRVAFTRGDQSDPNAWAARASLLGPPEEAGCLLPFCTLWTENTKNLYCKSHATRWAQLGRPDSAAYLALPAARQGIHRLPRPARPAHTRVAVRGAVPPRPGHDHHGATDRGLDHPPGQRRRRDLAARS